MAIVVCSKPFEPSTVGQLCADAGVIRPGPSGVGKMVTISTPQDSQPVIEQELTDSEGRPVDLSQCDPTDVIKLRIQEAMRCDKTVHEATGSIVDAAKGVIRATVPKEATATPGLYAAEWLIFNEEETCVLKATAFQFLVESNIADLSKPMRSGPPSLLEIRMYIMDQSADANTLLQDVEFEDSEIALAIRRPVEYWNEIPPPIGVFYTTQTFPYRFHWLEAITGDLMAMAAHKYRRNHMPYSAANVSVDDMNKFGEYERRSRERWGEYRQWVHRTKVGLNIEQAWGSTHSTYAYL